MDGCPPGKRRWSKGQEFDSPSLCETGRVGEWLMPAVCYTSGMNQCGSCGKTFRPKRARIKFCSLKCRPQPTTRTVQAQKARQHQEYIQRWLAGQEDGMRGKTGISAHIRKYLFEKYQAKCSRCSWCKINPFTKKIPLEIEHIDGNWKNNAVDNLDLVCPNCHSLTATYKSRNKGKGRPGRANRLATVPVLKTA